MYIYIFTAAAIFILFIACINFMNLATARSGMRAKEVGMRKAIGAFRTDIIKQFFGESILLSFTALLLAVILLHLLLPLFNDLAGKELSLSNSGYLAIFLGLMGIALFTGLVSGSYPALFLSSFQTVNVIKNLPQSGTKGSVFRKILVVTQFSLTIIILIGTIIVHDQLNHIRNQNLGYDKNHIVCFPLRGDIIEKLDVLSHRVQSSRSELIRLFVAEKLAEKEKEEFERSMAEGYLANYDFIKKSSNEWNFTLKDGL